MVEIGDLGIDGGGFGEGPACVRSRVHKLVLTLIEVEQRRAVVAHKEQVGVAVIVKVSENRASHATLGGRKTGGGGQVRERAVAVVAVEAAGDAGKIIGEDGRGLPRRVQVRVGGHDQVHESVVVSVEEQGACIELVALAAQASLLCFVHKRAVTLVAIERDPVQTGHEKARMAAVVVVGKRGGDASAPSGHARLFGHVGERPIAVVMEQVIRSRRDDHVKVGMAVAVVVAHGNGGTEMRGGGAPEIAGTSGCRRRERNAKPRGDVGKHHFLGLARREPSLRRDHQDGAVLAALERRVLQRDVGHLVAQLLVNLQDLLRLVRPFQSRQDSERVKERRDVEVLPAAESHLEHVLVRVQRFG